MFGSRIMEDHGRRTTSLQHPVKDTLKEVVDISLFKSTRDTFMNVNAEDYNKVQKGQMKILLLQMKPRLTCI